MDRIQQIKYKRLKPEERFLYDILINIEPISYLDNEICYIHNDKRLMHYNIKYDMIWHNYIEIGKLFDNKINGKETYYIANKICSLIKDINNK